VLEKYRAAGMNAVPVGDVAAPGHDSHRYERS
jgi:hypothetical protein